MHLMIWYALCMITEQLVFNHWYCTL